MNGGEEQNERGSLSSMESSQNEDWASSEEYEASDIDNVELIWSLRLWVDGWPGQGWFKDIVPRYKGYF